MKYILLRVIFGPGQAWGRGRAQGWGRLMVEYAQYWGRLQNARSLRLMVDSGNQRAIRLYRKCGLQTDRKEQFWMRGADVRSG